MSNMAIDVLGEQCGNLEPQEYVVAKRCHADLTCACRNGYMLRTCGNLYLAIASACAGRQVGYKRSKHTCRVSTAQDVKNFKIPLAWGWILSIDRCRTARLDTFLWFSPWAMPFVPCPHVMGQPGLRVPLQRSRCPGQTSNWPRLRSSLQGGRLNNGCSLVIACMLPVLITIHEPASPCFRSPRR